jgi:hypothetical protein
VAFYYRITFSIAYERLLIQQRLCLVHSRDSTHRTLSLISLTVQTLACPEQYEPCLHVAKGEAESSFVTFPADQLIAESK